MGDGVTNIVFGPVSGVTAGKFTVPDDATNSEIFRVVLAARDSGGRTGTVASTLFRGNATSQWASEYPFDSNANDANGYFNGALQGGASIVGDPDRGHVLNLSGAGQYVSLPSAVHNMQYFGAWVKWNGGAAWQRIFDFGSGTARWVMLTPKNGNGTMQCAISSDTPSFTHVIEAPEALPVNKWTHVAVAFDGREGILYVNGQAVAVNNSVNLLPADVATTQAWLGKSQYSVDAFFNGRLDSVWLNSTAPTPSEIISSFLHPNLGMTFSGPGAVFSWPEWAGLMNLDMTTNLVPPFQWNQVAEPATLSNGVYSVSVPGTERKRILSLAVAVIRSADLQVGTNLPPQSISRRLGSRRSYSWDACLMRRDPVFNAIRRRAELCLPAEKCVLTVLLPQRMTASVSLVLCSIASVSFPSFQA